MKDIINQIVFLIQFMTRIYVPLKVEYSEEKLAKGIKYFPLIGYFIGLIIFVIANILNKYVDNKYIISLLIILLELKLVGLIHVDGLADSFDGLFSYRDKDKILEIMKDSRVGTNGVVILIFYNFNCRNYKSWRYEMFDCVSNNCKNVNLCKCRIWSVCSR